MATPSTQRLKPQYSAGDTSNGQNVKKTALYNLPLCAEPSEQPPVPSDQTVRAQSPGPWTCRVGTWTVTAQGETR